MAYGSKFIVFQYISKAWQKEINEKYRRLENRQIPNKAAVTYVDKWIQDNFKSDGKKAHGPKGWQPLHPLTLWVKSHRVRKPTRKPRILRDVGYLKGRWKHLYTAKTAAIQSGVDYGLQHDSDNEQDRIVTIGGEKVRLKSGEIKTMGYRKVKLPQRKILPRYQQVWPDIKKIFSLFLRKVLK